MLPFASRDSGGIFIKKNTMVEKVMLCRDKILDDYIWIIGDYVSVRLVRKNTWLGEAGFGHCSTP